MILSQNSWQTLMKGQQRTGHQEAALALANDSLIQIPDTNLPYTKLRALNRILFLVIPLKQK